MRIQTTYILPAIPRVILSLILVISSYVHAAGIWTDNLDIEGVGNFTTLHQKLAARETLITESLITLKGFEGTMPASINLYNSDGTLYSSPDVNIRFNMAGVLLDNTLGNLGVGPTARPLRNYTVPLSNAFTSSNIVVASISANVGTATEPQLITLDIEKDVHYRLNLAQTPLLYCILSMLS
jgi:hypothetical protein